MTKKTKKQQINFGNAELEGAINASNKESWNKEYDGIEKQKNEKGTEDNNDMTKHNDDGQGIIPGVKSDEEERLKSIKELSEGFEIIKTKLINIEKSKTSQIIPRLKILLGLIQAMEWMMNCSKDYGDIRAYHHKTKKNTRIKVVGTITTKEEREWVNKHKAFVDLVTR